MRRMIVMLALAAAAVVGRAAAEEGKFVPDARDKGPDRIDVSKWPEDQQGHYRVFIDKCNKCHTVARPINSRFTAEEWKRYLKRMLRRPDCNIDEEQARHIYEFLKFWSVKQGS